MSMKHILDEVFAPSRDPDARMEARSVCGVWEECSGSGRHYMVGPDEADCYKCKRIIAAQKMARFNEEADEAINEMLSKN